MSRNFTTDVDTQREYFNASYFNQSGQNQIAKYETTLLKPFFHDPDKWKLAINRMRVPLSGIPLTRNNIPFQQWEVGIYFNNGNGNGRLQDAYVPQINPQSKTLPLNWNIGSVNTNGTLTMYTTLTNDINTVIRTYNINGIIQNPLGGVNNNALAYDTLGTSGHIYVLTTAGNVINKYDTASGVLVSSINTGGPVLGITVNPSTGDLYDVYTDGTNNYVQLYKNGVYTSQIIMAPVPPIPQANEPQITYFNGYIYYVNNGDLGTSYTFTNSNLTTSSATVSIGYNLQNPMFSINNNCVYFTRVSRFNNSLIQKYSQNLNGTLTLSGSYDTGLYEYGIIVLGDDYQGNTLYTDMNSHLVNALNFNNNTIVYTSNNFGQPPIYPIMSLPSANTTIPVDSGPYNIFTYQQFLNQINLAFKQCFESLKTNLGASFLPTEPPSIIFNPQTKLFNLISIISP